MNSIQLNLRKTTKEKIYIITLFLIIPYNIWGCFPKNVAHEFISKDSQYIPKDMALEYLNNFFDITSEGILLEKHKKGFNLEMIYKRFLLKDTSFKVETGTSDKFYWVEIRHKYNPKPHLIGFHKGLVIEGPEKVKKICTALYSLGVSIE